MFCCDVCVQSKKPKTIDEFMEELDELENNVAKNFIINILENGINNPLYSLMIAIIVSFTPILNLILLIMAIRKLKAN